VAVALRHVLSLKVSHGSILQYKRSLTHCAACASAVNSREAAASRKTITVCCTMCVCVHAESAFIDASACFTISSTNTQIALKHLAKKHVQKEREREREREEHQPLREMAVTRPGHVKGERNCGNRKVNESCTAFKKLTERERERERYVCVYWQREYYCCSRERKSRLLLVVARAVACGNAVLARERKRVLVGWLVGVGKRRRQLVAVGVTAAGLRQAKAGTCTAATAAAAGTVRLLRSAAVAGSGGSSNGAAAANNSVLMNSCCIESWQGGCG
jgi:hypothetical protein